MKHKKVINLIAIGELCLSMAFLSLKVNAEKYQYDKFHRVIKVEYDDGSYVTYKYDDNGNIFDVYVYDASQDNPDDEDEDDNDNDSDNEQKENDDNKDKDSKDDKDKNGKDDKDNDIEDDKKDERDETGEEDDDN